MAYDLANDYAPLTDMGDSSLLDLLDRILDNGIVAVGDLRLSVAGVDLLYVGVKALICSIETAEKYRAHHIVVGEGLTSKSEDPS